MIIFKYIFVLYVVLLIIKMDLYIYFSVIRHIDILNFLVYNFRYELERKFNDESRKNWKVCC